MSLKRHLYFWASAPILAILVLVAVSWSLANGIMRETDALVDNHFKPLIEKDIHRLLGLEKAIKLILQAEVEAHQVLIAEKAMLTAEGEESFQAALEQSRKSMLRVEENVENASSFFDQETKALKTAFSEACALWKEKTEKIANYASQPEKLVFARRISEGTALKAFGQVKKSLEAISQALEKEIQSRLAVIQSKELEVHQIRDSARRNATRAIAVFIIAGVLAAVGFWMMGIFLARRISQPMTECARLAEKISQGDYSQRLALSSQDEIGALATAFNAMSRKLEETVDLAQEIARGNLERHAESRSGTDRLSLALAEMTQALRESKRQDEKQNWLKTGLNDLATTMRGEQDVAKLAQKIISFLAKRMDSQVGALMIAEEGERLRWAAGHAFSRTETPRDTVRFGEGFAGQAALERKTIVLDSIPVDYLPVNSGLGQMKPSHIVIQSCAYADKVEAIVELASLSSFSDLQLEFLEEASEAVAVALHSIRARSQAEEFVI